MSLDFEIFHWFGRLLFEYLASFDSILGQTALIQLLKESHLFQQPDFIKLSITKAFQINTDSKLTLLENLYVLTDDSCPDDLGRSILSGNIRNTIIDEGKGSKRHKC